MNVIEIILKGILSLLLQPVFYLSILLAVLAGFNRVKWERRSFSVRIYSPFLELKNFFTLGIGIAIVLSIVSFFIGFGVMQVWIVIFNIVTVLVLIVAMFRLSSTAITIGISSLVFYFCYYYDIKFGPLQDTLLSYDALYIDNFMIAMTFLLAILLFVEAWLIQHTSAKSPSPSLRKSGRGKLVGGFQLRKLWFIPLIAFVPGTEITHIFDFWPIFNIGSESYTLVLLPLVIGFQQQTRSELPEDLSQKIAMQVTTLAVIVAAIGLVSIVSPVMTLVAFVLAIISRFWISWRFYRIDKNAPLRYKPEPDGIVILGARENTPSSRMHLVAGEKITEVNSVPVKNRTELYEALNKNRAFCKLKVVGLNGEPRFEQTALYENESFELGLLLVEPR
ncbi:serine protease [Listeria valentina]|uniref:serine protease n=1 Tax=Listeria valentina TaxID=2705293 RepID=UPI001431A27B|nr:serine protease [Listeria valentina]